MIGNTFKSSKNRRGSVIMMTIFAAIFLLGMAALVTDVGYMYYSQSRLQTAVNAGWKAGYDRMMQHKADDGKLSDAEKSLVISHIKEVMRTNGYTDAQLSDLQIAFGPNNYIEVSSNQDVGLFFANVMNFHTATVAARRENHALDVGQGIVPLAIPHGETFDLTKNTYLCNLFSDGTSGGPTGFTPGQEYILKLGSGGGKGTSPGVDPDLFFRILVPMDSKGQSSDNAFLKAYGVVHWALGQEDLVPVDWLIGYRGGSFMFPYHVDILNRLSSRGISHTTLSAVEASDIYSTVGVNNLSLSYQPILKVYSSQSSDDPVEIILKTAEIPYGGTGNAASFAPYKIGRFEAFDGGYCNNIYDDEILSGGLETRCHWLHLHHEDFMGNDEGKEPGGSAAENSWATNWGYVSNGGYTAFQVARQDIAYKVREFVKTGHMMYTQCFATESLDGALWMRRLRLGLADPYADCLAFTGFTTTPATYDKDGNLIGGYPTTGPFTTINDENEGGYSLQDSLDPRQQNHKMAALSGFSGITTSFSAAVTRTSGSNPVSVLGKISGQSYKYLSGKIEKGEFAYMGGHSAPDIYGKRLVLNNVLLGSKVAEQIATGGGGTVVSGKSKSNYGPVDPDNYGGGGANDYRNRFMFGFNQPIQLGDRIIAESGNMAGPTDQSVEFRVVGDAEFPPNTIIIVPITDIGPEVAVNNTKNASASTIYDLQGSDHPKGIYDPALYGFGSSIRVIGFAVFEILAPSDYTRDGENFSSGDLGPYQSGQVRGKFIRYVVDPKDVTVN